ncbi:MAG: hypothetical protein RLZZ457_1191 [Pseudomonadota bacterium]
MTLESNNTQSASPSVDGDSQNARLAFKLVALVVCIFLITLWKFRPV